jgi:hypothetical protein
VAVSDLGGLGAREGSPAVYNWTLPNLLPVLLPWLFLLLLLLLKPNRCAQAWWIWVPVGCVAALGAALQSEMSFVPSSLLDILGGAVGAIGFGLAAVWLVSGYLGWKHRLLAWLGIWLTLGSVSLLALGIRQGLEGMGPEMVQGAILLLAGATVISVAITLAGLLCRGGYARFRLCGWLIAALLVVWLLVIGPFFIVAMMFSPGNVPVLALIGTVLSVAGISFGTVLPFLILSFANAFYRERLKALLHLGREAPPPVIAPPVPVASAVAGS